MDPGVKSEDSKFAGDENGILEQLRKEQRHVA